MRVFFVGADLTTQGRKLLRAQAEFLQIQIAFDLQQDLNANQPLIA
ncbi:hypothetical protein NITHO_2890009 [Nitrolancea hollandica Lb]|uniref:Uncharacterized protein n=1 Tax=Nitrolancea hollandica Lb TaxID=1129897 RepID=I4EGY2_9BACT|nr:hypothetical protein NITHO_2890009 [Nitrolancea hollandica Lb]